MSNNAMDWFHNKLAKGPVSFSCDKNQILTDLGRNLPSIWKIEWKHVLNGISINCYYYLTLIKLHTYHIILLLLVSIFWVFFLIGVNFTPYFKKNPYRNNPLWIIKLPNILHYFPNFSQLTVKMN